MYINTIQFTPIHKDDADGYAQIKAFYDKHSARKDESVFLPKNMWIQALTFEVYVRYRPRHIDGDFIYVLDIANVQVWPFYRRKGHYSQLLDFAYDLIAPGEAVFIENVMFEEHYDFYLRRGFVEYTRDDPESVKSFYKLKR